MSGVLYKEKRRFSFYRMIRYKNTLTNSFNFYGKAVLTSILGETVLITIGRKVVKSIPEECLTKPDQSIQHTEFGSV